MHKIGILCLQCPTNYGKTGKVILSQFSRHKKNNLKLFTGTHQTIIRWEKSTEHLQRNEKMCRTHRESIRSECIENLATREKLEVWGIISTLGNYQIAV